jgi:hypothetical protein
MPGSLTYLRYRFAFQDLAWLRLRKHFDDQTEELRVFAQCM